MGWNDSSVGLDFHELTEFEQRVIRISQKDYPKETKKFMQRAGNKFRTLVRGTERSKLKYKDGRKTGNLLHGLKRGRAYLYSPDRSYQVRVSFARPAYHAWLVEHGHDLYFHHKPFQHARYGFGYVKGNHAVSQSIKQFNGQFVDLAKKFVDDFIEKGFS